MPPIVWYYPWLQSYYNANYTVYLFILFICPSTVRRVGTRNVLLRAHNYRRTGENELAERCTFPASRPQDNVWTEAKYRDFSEFSAHSLPKGLQLNLDKQKDWSWRSLINFYRKPTWPSKTSTGSWLATNRTFGSECAENSLKSRYLASVQTLSCGREAEEFPLEKYISRPAHFRLSACSCGLGAAGWSEQ